MPVDPTIPLSAQAPAYNPLSQAMQYAQAGNALMGFQVAKKELAAKTALGTIAQNAINPDGSFNSAAFMSGVKNDPDASFAAAQAINQGQRLGGQQFGLNQDAINQTTNRVNSIGAGLSGLLSNPNLSSQDVVNGVAGQAAAGKPIGEFVDSVLTSMPPRQPGESPASYSARLRPWLAGVVGQSAGPEAALHTLTPQVATVGLGGTTQTMDVNPYSNPTATDTTFRNTLSPEGQATPVPGPVGPNGQETIIPRAGYAAANGLGGLIPGGSPFGTGRPGGLPPSLLNLNRLGRANAPDADSGAPGADFGTAGGNGSSAAPTGTVAPMVTRLGPGQEAGLRAAGDASAQQWASLQQQVGGTAAGGGSAGRIYQLQSALSDLNRLGQTGSGPSAGTVNTIKSYLASIPEIGNLVPGSSIRDIANHDQANKALTNYATARAGAHGGTTDSQLATVLTGNASTHISNLAATNVIKANIALERMDQAQAQAFSTATDPQTGQPLRPDQFAAWSANWNRNTDARAFMVDQLSPQQFRSAVGGMSPADRARFQNTYNLAVRNGWVSPPSWATPPANGATAGAAVPGAGPSAVYPTGMGN